MQSSLVSGMFVWIAMAIIHLDTVKGCSETFQGTGQGKQVAKEAAAKAACQFLGIVP